MNDFKRLNRELSHKGEVVEFYTDTIKLPDGRTAKWDHVSHNGAAAVVAVNDQNKILMVRQYRNSLERMTLELPAGGVNSLSEPTIICAARELEEETGYRSENLEFLLSVKTAVAFSNENIDIYLAKDLVKSKQNLDPDEFINVEEYDIETLIDMIHENKIQDSKTIAGIFSYYFKYVK